MTPIASPKGDALSRERDDTGDESDTECRSPALKASASTPLSPSPWAFCRTPRALHSPLGLQRGTKEAHQRPDKVNGGGGHRALLPHNNITQIHKESFFYTLTRFSAQP